MFSSWKKSYGSWRRKIKRRKQIKKAKALSEQKTKVKKEKDESKESVWGNIWKDILLLLILLALLLLIGFYFYSNNPFYSGNETISNVSDNDPYGVATGTYDSATGDLLIIEDVIDEDINDEVVNDSSDEGMGPVEVEPTEVEKTLIYIEENNLTDSFHYLVIESGESKEVDLGQNFVDPDGDELFFNVEGITNENVTIDIWKGVATIKAVEGFTGLVNASFDAEDPSGETVSAEMTIVVKEKEDKTLSDYLESYVSYIIIGIIIIILLIVIIVLYGKIVKEDEKKKDSKGNKKEKGFFKSF